MNFLETLVAEWYQYTGHLVRTNPRTRKRARGGWDVELDVSAAKKFPATVCRKRPVRRVDTCMYLLL
jgi:hypothetical protein